MMHTLALPLKMNKSQTAVADRRFFYMSRLHNSLVKHARKCLNSLNHDKEYRSLLKKLKTAKENNLSCKDIYDELNELRSSYGLTKMAFEEFIKVQQSRYRKHISSQQAQKEADRIWTSVEKVLYGNGKTVHFKKLDDITISSKSMNGCHYLDRLHPNQFKKDEILYPDGQIVWMGEYIKVNINWTDPYIVDSINHEISYCEIKRRMFNNGWHYYVVLYLEGDAPIKHSMGKGTAGCDPGMSSMCVLTDDKLHFDELAPKCKEYNKKISKIQRKIDRSKHKYNPDNYNEDGTIKKGRHKWVLTKSCKKLQRQLKCMYRKKHKYTACEHNRLANMYIKECDTFITEAMDYKALAKRSRKTERQDTSTVINDKEVFKYKKKKRFGKSVTDRSPGLLLKIMEYKLLRQGGDFIRADTTKLKASQYRHDTDAYEKIPLSQRSKEIDGQMVLRDPYSTFIIKNSNNDHNAPDRDKCIRNFEDFLNKQKEMIGYMTSNNVPRPACFGF